ncbi:hypothetical protein [Paracoccus rhizosphaerae]|uniref:Uncharacterized protein n=1 Tax=Paracoccus rhizosphaerae TaxID=1133347 RepID=A0ABV6CQ66_9RHOB|nr:hypothetical protein [Paracoccus rhizosphaerae]
MLSDIEPLHILQFELTRLANGFVALLVFLGMSATNVTGLDGP